MHDKAQIASVLRHRLNVRTSLAAWCEHNGFTPAAHHKLLIGKLEKLTLPPSPSGEEAGGHEDGTHPPTLHQFSETLQLGIADRDISIPHNDPKQGGFTNPGLKLDRLAVFMPPGAAKSTYASILFPPWYLAHNPGHSVIAASHTADLAAKWGRRVRNIIKENGHLLGYALAEDSQAADRWETDSGAEYGAFGVGGSVTGRRADLIVIDDPVRSREDAESETIREKTWDWYISDLYTRLKPGGRIVLIQTRWHEDDLAGRILANMDGGGDRWDVLSLPAIAEHDDALGRAPGEPLWPEWEDLEALDRKREAVGPRNWTALYQQRPAPEEGDFFKAEWLKVSDTRPPLSEMKVYGGSDYAVTSDGGDYTVHVVVGLDSANRMHLLDVWRGQTTTEVWIEKLCDLIKLWKPMAWAEETGQIKSGVGPFIDRMQRERKAWCFRETFPTRGDKAVRAQSIRGRMALEGLYCPFNASWFPEFRRELLSFPAGKYDDQVDALGLIGQLLDKMLLGAAAKQAAKRKIDTGYATKKTTPKIDDWVVQ
jgi:predicted phage terminase large subunit-like protein